MRGDILHFEAGAGVIAGEDGNRYAFEAADFRRDAPRAGLTVDFVADGGTAREIYPLGVMAMPQAIAPQFARPVAGPGARIIGVSRSSRRCCWWSSQG